MYQSKARMIFLALVFAGIVLSICNRAIAQAVSSASISGRVVDPVSAVVVGAKIKVTALDTGLVHETESNSEGLYNLPNLPVGPYTLQVAQQGFQTFVQSGIVLRVNDSVQINVSLTVGLATESIEVQSDISMVQTQQNNISQVIDQRRIVELPLNGRDVTQLITISGASVNHSDGTNTGNKSFLTAQSISVAGGAGNQTNYLLDGGDNNDSFTNVNLPFPFPDALQEFSVETNTLPARNGLHPGGLVNAVTKSGSNQVHGSAFYFVRNYLLNGINYFSTRQDSLKRNQFGGTIGGHVIRDKLFYFGGYQGSRIRQDPSSTAVNIPTAAALAGDFSVLDGVCTNRAITNPVTGESLPSKKIDPSYFDPAALNLVSHLPVSSADQCGRVYYGVPVKSNETQYITRVDYNMNAKHSLFGRYFYDDYQLAAYFSPENILVTTGTGNSQRVQSLTLGDTYIFSPSLVNSLHFTFSRRRIDRGPGSEGINAASLGVQNIYQGTPNYLQLSVTNGGFSTGSGSGALGIFNVNSFQETDDIDWTKGKHQFAFGVDIIRTQDNVNSHYEDNGWFQFSGQYSGDSLLDFLTGKMYRYEQTMPQQIAYRQTLVELYAQDTFHVTPKLVLNAGLRWEPTLYPQDYFNRGSTFSRDAYDAGQKSQVYVNAPAGSFFYGDSGVSKSFTQNTYTNLSPRVGLVYNPDGEGKTTFRAGGAVMYDSLATYLTYRVSANNLPFGVTITNQSGPYQFSNPWSSYSGGNPFPFPSKPDKDFNRFTVGASQVLLPNHIKPVTMYQWNVGMQHQFSSDWIFTLSYLGNRSIHMMLGNEINPAVYIPGTWTGPGSCGALTASPGVGKPCSSTGNTQARRVLNLANPTQGAAYGTQVIAYDNAFSSYHGMLVAVEHRFAKNYSVLANYTWSKCMFTGAIISLGVEGTIMDPNNPRADYGPCTYDATNILNVTGVVSSNVKSGNRVVRSLLNNWQVAPILRYQSGLPFNPTVGKDNSLNGVGLDRPNRTEVNPYTNAGHTSKLYQYIAVGSYTANPAGTFGNAGKNSLRAPGYFDIDAAVSRNFALYERLHLQLRFEAFNVLNHPNFNAPVTSISAANFGQVTSAQDPRILQAAAKFTF